MSKKLYNKLKKHIGHFGLYLKQKEDKTIELRCFARIHSGNDILLMSVSPESNKKLIEGIASMIGEGVHAGLRKQCQSHASNSAYNAIVYMPDEEWGGVCRTVAEEIVNTFLRSV